MIEVTVASRPKILQNNSKPAAGKNFWPRKVGGRTAADFYQKQPKTGRIFFTVKTAVNHSRF